jgi:ubiquinone/menaquinone biosynthesis C-methylase UbiE
MSLDRERERILAEYQRRQEEIPAERYAPWNAAEELLRSGRRRRAARLLHRLDCFPQAGSPVLEVGVGRLGWLADLLGWGLKEGDLHGIDLDPERIEQARRALPGADLRLGDATTLPWADGHFQLVVASTVFSSILDPTAQETLAREIQRVLEPGGALLWYDLRWNNPANPQVRKIPKFRLRQLFPELRGAVVTTSLAPPLARVLAPFSFGLAALLEELPFLRSHLLAVLRKPAAGGRAS